MLLELLPNVLFVLLLGVAVGLFAKNVKKINRNIQLGAKLIVPIVQVNAGKHGSHCFGAIQDG